MPKQRMETYKLLTYKSTKPDGSEKTETSTLNEARAEKALERATKDGDVVEVTRSKSFNFYEVEASSTAGEPPDWDVLVNDFKALVPDAAEAANIINRGYTLKQNTIVQDYMDDAASFNPEGIYDLREDASKVRERKSASPEEKLISGLAKLTPEQLMKVLANFKNAGAPDAASA